MTNSAHYAEKDLANQVMDYQLPDLKIRGYFKKFYF
jgi:hypothetical protein